MDMPDSPMVEVVKNVGGRPTKYKDEYATRTLAAYLTQAVDKEEEFVKGRTYNQDGELSSEAIGTKSTVDLPSIVGYARYLGVSTSTLHLWAKSNQGFSDSLKEIMEEQQYQLTNKGLKGTYSPIMSKLLLSANHGISEKSTIEHEFTMKELVGQQEAAETVLWDDSSSHLMELAEGEASE